MELQSGKYVIVSKEKEYKVGRNNAEDKSLNPKMILALQGLGWYPTWEIEKQASPGHYILKTRDTPTANIDGLVYALLVTDYETPTVWLLNKHPIFGENCYTITVADQPGLGWKAPTASEQNGNGQIAIKPLIIIPGFPPQYPKTMLFDIIKVD